MVEFALPKNSRIGVGTTHPAPENATNIRRFLVYRWSPDGGKNPSIDTYEIDMDACGPMVLDAIVDEKFWILTHPEMGEVAVSQTRAMIDDQKLTR